MVYYQIMIKVNIVEAKAKLSEFLDQLARGEQVIICKRNHPVAELRLIASARTSPRPIGGGKGHFTVPASFFESLPEEIVESFYPAGAVAVGRGVRVAEPTASYRASKSPRARVSGRRRRH